MPCALASFALLALAANNAAEGAVAADSRVARTPAAATASAATPDTAVTDTLQRAAPDFMLPDLDGVPRRFLGYPGRVHLLVYWSPECPECIEEMPGLAKLYAREHEHGLAVIGVTYPRLRADAAAFAKDHALGFPILLDTDSRVAKLYRVQTTPTVWVVRDGRVLWRHAGFDLRTPDAIGHAVEAALR
jgi:peroxiredoxin